MEPIQHTTYYTHDNGSRPYKVEIIGGKVFVYTELKHDLDSNLVTYNSRPIIGIGAEKILIGKSPHNETSDFDGNSILLYVGGNTHIYIGHEIYQFVSYNPIVNYVSPIGNNDSPYPYAVCANGDILLMLEKVRLLNPQMGEYTDPYSYYYSISYITGPDGEPGRGNIEKTYVGNSTFSMNYVVNPSEDYDRLTRNGGNEELGGPVFFKLRSPDTTIQVSKAEYVDTIEQFGRQNGISPVNVQWLLGI